jgi:hypothetical protein
MRFLLMAIFSINTLSAVTIEEWEKYSKEQKIEHIENEVDWKDIAEKDIINQTEDIQDYVATLVETEMDLEIYDDVHPKIGPMKRSFSFVRSEEGIIIGAMEYFSQQGCSKHDENGDFSEANGYYETEAEANDDECFDNDVSWSGHVFRDELGIELANSDYMEWTGH